MKSFQKNKKTTCIECEDAQRQKELEKIMKIKQNTCPNLGFYQRDFFCEICQKIEPKVFQYCLKETKRKLETNEITQEQVEELLKNR